MGRLVEWVKEFWFRRTYLVVVSMYADLDKAFGYPMVSYRSVLPFMACWKAKKMSRLFYQGVAHVMGRNYRWAYRKGIAEISERIASDYADILRGPRNFC